MAEREDDILNKIRTDDSVDLAAAPVDKDVAGNIARGAEGPAAAVPGPETD